MKPALFTPLSAFGGAGAGGPPVVFTEHLAISRASTSYAQTVAGTLTSFAANTLRITDKGLLVEEARTNLLTHSQDFANAYWTKGDVTLTSTTAAPDGTATATTVTAAVTDTYHRLYSGSDIATTVGLTSYSIYAKAGTCSWILLYGPVNYAWFNVGTGVVGSNGGAGTQRIEALAGGWYRCSWTCTTTGGSNMVQVFMGTADSGGTLPTFPGPLTLHIWGAQVEMGLYPTSYIPTTSVAVTRPLDVVTLIGTSASTITSAAASVVASVDAIPKITEHRIVGSTVSARAPLIKSNGTQVEHWNGTLALVKSGLASSATGPFKYGSAWTLAGGRSVTGQGLAVATDANTTAALGTVTVGSDGATPASGLDTYVKRLKIWNSRLSDADLVAETGAGSASVAATIDIDLTVPSA